MKLSRWRKCADVKPAIDCPAIAGQISVRQAIRSFRGAAIVRILRVGNARGYPRSEVRAGHHAPDPGDIPPADNSAEHTAFHRGPSAVHGDPSRAARNLRSNDARNSAEQTSNQRASCSAGRPSGRNAAREPGTCGQTDDPENSSCRRCH